MNYAQIRNLDVANGPGIRTSLFVSGCNFDCYNCFNKEYQDFNYGEEFTKTTEEKILKLLKDKKIAGLSVLGGEPMLHHKRLTKLFKQVNKPIWVWTGFKIEDIIELEALKYIDVLVDGQFKEEQKDLNLIFRGSANQRIIDVKETLDKGKIKIIHL